MKRKGYTDQEKEILLKNENILSVSSTNIKYCPRFKLRAVTEYYEGVSPIQIFINSGINIEIIGRENPQRCLKRWKNIFKKNGKKGLLEEQRGKSQRGGRPRTKPLTLKEAEARIALLEAENEFLKKLKDLEGRDV